MAESSSSPRAPRLGGGQVAPGTRERKRLETLHRIAEVGQRLFLSRGYDGTTLEDIAAAADISRRTFFSYFKSKDDIIFFWVREDTARLIDDLLKTSPDVPPLDAVRDVMLKRIGSFTTEQMTAIDNVMLSSAALQARKQAHYAEQEQALFEALCQVWRQPERRTVLRMVAMVSVGAMKVALQSWRDQAGTRKPIVKFMREAFDNLKTAVQ